MKTDKTIEDLFEDTLKGEFYEDAPWEAVFTLRAGFKDKKSLNKIFQKALEFCQSDNPLKCARGINVLAQLGAPKTTYQEACLNIALQNLHNKSDIVSEAAAWALSYIKGERAITALISVRKSANITIREAVATGLLCQTTPAAIEALLELMCDAEAEVRDYATWSLAGEPISGMPVDSEKIRQALHDRLEDEFEDVKLEALWGLAIRKDVVGLNLLLERFESDTWVSGDKSAAQFIFDIDDDISVPEICDRLRKVIQTTKHEQND